MSPKQQLTVAKRRLSVEILDHAPTSLGAQYKEQVADDLGTMLRSASMELISIKDIQLVEPEGQPIEGEVGAAEEAPDEPEDVPDVEGDQPEEVEPPEHLDFPIATEVGFVPLSEITRMWPPDQGGEG